LDAWTKVWHRLDPWPDSVEGLTRLKARFPIVTLSNGNVALMITMAKRAGLLWDAILGAEFTRSYKPDPATHLGTVAALGLEPNEVCLVAAHHDDLAVARGVGMQTAFVDRPQEYGGAPAPDRDAAQEWEYSWRRFWAADPAGYGGDAPTAGRRTKQFRAVQLGRCVGRYYCADQ
jgi:2-haloacid dehalogenase